MNIKKILAVLFFVISIGAINETFRILTSNSTDIVQGRAYLIPIALIMTSLVVGAAIYFWKKSK